MGEKVNKRHMKIMLRQTEDVSLPEGDFDNLIFRKRQEEERKKEVKKRRKPQNTKSLTGCDNQQKEENILKMFGLSIDTDEKVDVQVDKILNDGIEKKPAEIKKEASSNQHAAQSLYERSKQLKSKATIINTSSGLHVFNGRCFEPLTEESTIKLYRKNVDKRLGNEKNLSSISQIYRSLRTDPEIPMIEDGTGNRRIVNLLNGIYDLENHQLYEHSSKYISFFYIKANYKKHAKCPIFDSFVEQVTGGNSVLAERLWKFLGYILMQTNEAKVFFVMGVAPDSGKSVLGRFIESLYDEQYISNVSLNNFGKDFALSTLLGAAINLSLDLPEKQISSNAVATLKMLTGGDAINLNQKNIPEQRFVNKAKFVFATNNYIQIPGEDKAFWNRLIYLPFNISIPKEQQDSHLLEKFQEEKDAIVSKAIKYARKLIQAGFEFPTTDEIEEKVKQWRGITCDTVELFLRNCCRISSDYKGEILSDLYKEYMAYCSQKGRKGVGDREFKKYLEQKIHLEHFKMRRAGEGNPLSAFRGITLKKESEEEK